MRRLVDIDSYFSGMNISKETKDKLYETFGVDISQDNISIDWLRKELYEMLYERKITSDHIKVFIDLIARWRLKNERD